MSNHPDPILEQMKTISPNIQKEQELIIKSREQGKGAILKTFVRLSGPGWLQSAITLGGGSLSSSMYLGVLVGFGLLWLQPLAMLAGIIMLSAISYVTLSTGQRPLRTINEHVNPVLGWSWLVGAMLANFVWSMPQYSLAIASFQQNLLPQVFGPPTVDLFTGKVLAGLLILTINITFLTMYTLGGRGVKVFEIVVKIMVGSVVICFFGVVAVLTVKGQVRWQEYLAGFIPDFSLLFQPSKHLMPYINEVSDTARSYWTNLIVSQQRDVIISAAATAVGINMTFMLPYSMLRKGWDHEFRGLAIFDLSTGLFVPFVLATSCVVIASAVQFHAKPAPGFLGERDEKGNIIQPAPNLVGSFNRLLEDRISFEIGKNTWDNLSQQEKEYRLSQLPEVDRKLSAMLVRRDAFNLSDALKPLTGSTVARYIFGIGVLGMGLGVSTMLMVINSLCFCELLNRPFRGWTQFFGGLMVSISLIGVLFWKDAQMWLAIPTSVFCMTLLPLAYLSFWLLLNQKKLLKENTPQGIKWWLWNVLLGISFTLSVVGSLWSITSKIGTKGIGIVVIFLILVLIAHLVRKYQKKGTTTSLL
ncbi:MAG TPA: divalent metal cation transporter [Candidatus Hydrogenedens sp.]|nr:divalent metal cation transporter [Candidatus Hydrogenedens sp.]HOL19464.1 divalent metal cation transporter [Candidatus Hydrogenedens sp.]HPP59432.1 divalent metal cation transporter [Candidatus Hydrogenedens sp.]